MINFNLTILSWKLGVVLWPNSTADDASRDKLRHNTRQKTKKWSCQAHDFALQMGIPGLKCEAWQLLRPSSLQCHPAILSLQSIHWTRWLLLAAFIPDPQQTSRIRVIHFPCSVDTGSVCSFIGEFSRYNVSHCQFAWFCNPAMCQVWSGRISTSANLRGQKSRRRGWWQVLYLAFKGDFGC